MAKKIVFLALFSCCLTACETVQPWERGRLAKPEMQFNADGSDDQLYSQVYDSKEASSGGNGTAGAGCGCN